MDFGESIKTCLRKYATFSGRGQRSEYWWFYLFTLLASVAATFVDAALFSREWSENGPVGLGVSAAFLVPSLAATSRRLHDANLSGWWMVPPFVVIALSVIFMIMRLRSDVTVIGSPTVLIAIAALAGMGTFGLLLYWLIRRGTAGPNRFGPDPLKPVQVDGVF
ncbi:DUF805 domain-containing protein [Sandaracinobacter neustonicus]|uniref:DUF805 domain-containing protein n=1 Tax=Sandaracinobacter neustonicus TaxID=1715348 RepID=A0A501XUY5_9SPHN|nr:DUF805 domain-containing protein [Sandaracinobacter neustonicus]TPE64592.1 DUF805 domain-containing protein [Sandaracinobacter neustonicus]